jgi:hypothetical protein
MDAQIDQLISSLPNDYVPFEMMELCSNVLQRVRVPISVGHFPVLLLGHSDKPWPYLWLGARSSSTGEWNYIVEKGQSCLSALKHSVDADRQLLQVVFNSLVLVRVSFEQPDVPKITRLWLRPIGLDVTGSQQELMVATNRIINCSFTDVTVMLGLD